MSPPVTSEFQGHVLELSEKRKSKELNVSGPFIISQQQESCKMKSAQRSNRELLGRIVRKFKTNIACHNCTFSTHNICFSN